MIFFFKLKTAYDMRISGWSSDVCSSDLFLLCGRSHASPLACSTQESRWFGAPEPYLPRSGTHAGVWTCWPTPTADRKSAVSGKSVSVRVDLGGRRNIKKKKRGHSHTNDADYINYDNQ